MSQSHLEACINDEMTLTTATKMITVTTRAYSLQTLTQGCCVFAVPRCASHHLYDFLFSLAKIYTEIRQPSSSFWFTFGKMPVHTHRHTHTTMVRRGSSREIVEVQTSKSLLPLNCGYLLHMPQKHV